MAKREFHGWQKFGLVGVIVGVVNSFIAFLVYNYYVQFGEECIPPGEPFLTCGHALARMHYFIFYGQRNPILMFVANVLVSVTALLLLGFIYSKIKTQK